MPSRVILLLYSKICFIFSESTDISFKFSDNFSVEYSTNLYDIATKNRPGNFLNFVVQGVSRGAPFEEFIRDKGYLVTDEDDPNYGRRRRWDAAGYPTIGIGHLLTEQEENSGHILIGGRLVDWGWEGLCILVCG